MRNLIAFGLLLAGFSAAAQPVLDSRFAPRNTDLAHARLMHVQGNIGTNFPLFGVTKSDPRYHPGLGASQNWQFDFQADTGLIGTSTLAGPLDPTLAACFPAALQTVVVGGAVQTAGQTIVVAPEIGLGYVATPTGVSVSFRQNGSDRFEPPLPHLVYGMQLGQSRTDTSWMYVTSGSCPGVLYKWMNDTLQYAGHGTLSVNGGPAREAVLITHRSAQGFWNGPGSPVTPWGLRQTYHWLSPDSGKTLLYYDVIDRADVPDPDISIEMAHWNAEYFPAFRLPTALSAKAKTLGLHPNPATEGLQLEGAAAGRVRVSSATGAAMSLPVVDGRVDVSALTPGLYLLEAAGLRARFVKE